MIHEAHAQFVDDGLDLGGGGDGDVLLRLHEQKQRDQKKRGRPQPGLLPAAGVLHAGIDGGEDRRIADAAEAGHEDQLRQRAVHFAANELDRRTLVRVVRLHSTRAADGSRDGCACR